MILIVESPGKTKKIESLISGCKCYASMGHIMDLEKGFVSKFNPRNIDPKYCVLPDKMKTVSHLKSVCKGKASEIYIASDGDREGEAIAHDLIAMLGLSISRTKRIVFHEISKTAITNAINSPGRLNVDAYNAQQARRIIDIIFGYTISPLLWKYVEGKLSAGRCQSPTVKLIVDKQNLIQNHTMSSKKIKATCEVFYDFILNDEKEKDKDKKQNEKQEEKEKDKKDKKYKKEKQNKIQLNCCVVIEDVNTWLDTQLEKKYTYLIDKKEKKRVENPKSALTTSTLQQVVYNSHGIQPKECMQIAQKLYENGFISYHRTDSTCLSEEFQEKARDFVIKKYGEKYVGTVEKKDETIEKIEKTIETTKKKGKKTVDTKKNLENPPIQAAHEAIRPIDIHNFPSDQESLYVYRKIWNYAIGSLMSPAIYKDTYFDFGDHFGDLVGDKYGTPIWNMKHSFLEHEGYLILFGKVKDEEEEEKNKKNEQPTKVGDRFIIDSIHAKEQVESPPKPFTPAGLIKILEDSGIGRPSTYSTIISKILNKNYAYLGESETVKVSLKEWNYALKEKKCGTFEHKMGGHKNVYIATDLGIKANAFLEDACSHLIQPKFTEEMERHLDSIAKGTSVWTEVVADFYANMKKALITIPKKYENISNVEYPRIKWVRSYEFKNDKKKDEKENVEIGIINGKYGEVLAKAINGKIVKFSSFPPKTNLSDFTDDEILIIFKYPKKIGVFNDKDMILCFGKNGWYLDVFIHCAKDKIHVSNERKVPSKEMIKLVLDNFR